MIQKVTMMQARFLKKSIILSLNLVKVSFSFFLTSKIVIEGVRETGIHVKELQKIKYDFDNIVMSKAEHPSNMHKNRMDSEVIEKYEFVMLGQDALKELARKLGSFRVIEKPLSSYEVFENTQNYHSVGLKDSYRKDSMPTFGIGMDTRRKGSKDKKRASPNNSKVRYLNMV